MEQLTGLGKTIIATDQDRIRLDRAVKNILAYKPLLALIFKETVEECMNMSPKEIEDCIEGDVLVGKVCGQWAVECRRTYRWVIE